MKRANIACVVAFAAGCAGPAIRVPSPEPPRAELQLAPATDLKDSLAEAAPAFIRGQARSRPLEGGLVETRIPFRALTAGRVPMLVVRAQGAGLRDVRLEGRALPDFMASETRRTADGSLFERAVPGMPAVDFDAVVVASGPVEPAAVNAETLRGTHD
jgi:hypothetical protein